jgi:hypothetical protein
MSRGRSHKFGHSWWQQTVHFSSLDSSLVLEYSLLHLLDHVLNYEQLADWHGQRAHTNIYLCNQCFISLMIKP